MKYKKVFKAKKTDGYRVAIAVRTDGRVLTTTRHFESSKAASKFIKDLKSGKLLRLRKKKLPYGRMQKRIMLKRMM
jgi:hypothetical protein